MRPFITLLLAGCAIAGAQNERPVIRTTTEEVLLDVVVRDKKGRLVRDLKPSEIEVYDNGVRQKITGFRLVTGEASVDLRTESVAAGTPAGSPKPLDPLRQLRLVTIVYEGLDNESRRLARRASLEFLKGELEQNLYVSVFMITDRLQVLQPFTNDLERLREAVRRATSASYQQYMAEAEAIRQELEQMRGQLTDAQRGIVSPGRGGGSSDVGAAAATAQLNRMTLNILNFEEKLVRTQHSRSSLFSILSLVKEQAALPGRKTVIYFTRGLQVPENMVQFFRTTISAANRAGVSIYAVDARGLVVTSQNTAGISMLQSAVEASRRQQTDIEASITPEQVRVFDTAMDSMHADTQESLGVLATSTGGFLVANTNDLRAPVRRILEDALTYYEVSYVPEITEYDGKFHKLEVKVNRPGVRVQSRSGYFALPPDQDSIFAYEAPLLRALSQSPLPNSLPFQTSAIRFGPRQDGRVQLAVAIEVPLDALQPELHEDKGHYRTDLAVLAIVKDANGTVMDRFSRDFPFQIPKDRLEAFQQRRFLDTYFLSLPPGRYVLESAVMDRVGLKLSARRVSVMVPRPRPGVNLSSICLVRRMDPQPSGAGPGDPLYYQGRRVVPTLDEKVKAVAGAGVSFYFVVYPKAEAAEKPQLFLQVSKDGLPMGTMSADLPEPEEDGRIPFFASLPFDSLKPGRYELRVIVKQGESAAEQHTVFTVQS